ncbi:MAG: hypothetical protein ACOVNY_10000, partial [Chitinophagaceae bacterium]
MKKTFFHLLFLAFGGILTNVSAQTFQYDWSINDGANGYQQTCWGYSYSYDCSRYSNFYSKDVKLDNEGN